MASDTILREGWQVLELGDLGKIVTGKTPSTKVADNFGGDIPFITPSDMDDRRIIAHTDRYLTGQGASSVSSARIPKGAVMVSCIGSDMGKTAIAGCDAVTNQQINSIIVEKGISNLYVYYNLSTRKSEIQHIGSSGSAVPILNKGHFSQLRIMLPSLAEQRAIAHILGTLDDKIELNRRMNQTLEGIARALFKSWFVDFDPVRVKAKELTQKALKTQEALTFAPFASLAPFALNPAIADLFPDEFVDSELGEIPKGWRIANLHDICSSIFSGGTPSTQNKTFWDGEVSWLSSGETREHFIIATEKTITPAGVEGSSTRLARAGATVIASAGQGHTRGQTSLLLLDSYINQSVVALEADDTQSSSYYLFFDLDRRYEQFRQISDSHSSRGSLTTKLLGEVRVIVPRPEIVRVFNGAVESLVHRIQTALYESRTLAALRDTLLPKLISGELRVPEVSM